ncbi:hypothetical protein [Pseudolysinimonas sp.]|jgi:hypothetical protein|uniref:hypothetical protein n=1 Tax=Pseudolysinimonas sp. TaxID=2680009 RepID=UPI0037845790
MTGRSGFRLRDLAIESVRNVLAARGLSVVTAAVALFASAAIVVGTAFEVHQLSGKYDEFVAAGGNVSLITPIEEGYLSAARCEELNVLPGVISAGGRSEFSGVHPALAPEVTAWIVRGTPTFADVMWPNLSYGGTRSSVTVGSYLVDRLGLTADSWLRLDTPDGTRDLQVGQIPLGVPRDPTYDRAIFVPEVGLAEVDSCFVEAEPSAASRVAKVLDGWFDQRVGISPFTHEIGPTDNDLVTRLSRFLPFGALFTVLAMFVVWIRARKADYALYQLLGMQARTRLFFASAEYLLLILVPMSIGSLVALVAARPLLTGGLVLSSVSLDLAVLASGSLLAPTIGVLALGRSDVVGELKGR